VRRRSPSPQPVILAAEAMRTRFELVLADDRDPRWLRAAGEEALEEIARVEAALSPFRADSVVSRLNEGGAVRVDGAIFSLLERAGRLTDAVGGAFDLTIGAISERMRRGEAVDAAARSTVGFARRVTLEGGTVTLAPGTRLDPGAIGKGYALERAAALLGAAGVQRALLHGGTSSVVALGAWPVAVQHPLRQRGRLARFELRDAALGVTALHGRPFHREGIPVGHVLDPRTGEPVAEALLAAVVTASPTDADALSTALLVLGERALSDLAARFPGSAFLLAIPDDGADVRVATAGSKLRDARRQGAALTSYPSSRKTIG
jgi:thiamine biosynthesis lipoprotein